MQEIRDVIRILSKHQFRSVSNVVGEFVERQIAQTLGGTQATHCQKGFDVLSKDLGNIEVKSRNYYAKSKLCQLPAHKIHSLDHFILALVKDGELDNVFLFDKQTLLSLQSSSGTVYIDQRHYPLAQNITGMFRPQV